MICSLPAIIFFTMRAGKYFEGAMWSIEIL